MRRLQRRLLLPLTMLLCLLPASTSGAVQSRGISFVDIFGRFLAEHLSRFRDDAPDAIFQMAQADLNGDNLNEVLVYLNHPIWCGPHGCDLLVFSETRTSRPWRQIAEISVGATPVRLLEGRTRGWRDLSLYVSTSLAPGEQTRFSFDGTTYSLSEQPISDGEIGRPLIERDSPSEPLFGPRPRANR